MRTRKVNFGKYRGSTWGALPKGYLEWMIEHCPSRRAFAMAELNLRYSIFGEAVEQPPITIDGLSPVQIEPHVIDFTSCGLLKFWLQLRRENEGLHQWLARFAVMADIHGVRLPDGSLELQPFRVVIDRKDQTLILRSITQAPILPIVFPRLQQKRLLEESFHD